MNLYLYKVKNLNTTKNKNEVKIQQKPRGLVSPNLSRDATLAVPWCEQSLVGFYFVLLISGTFAFLIARLGEKVFVRTLAVRVFVQSFVASYHDSLSLKCVLSYHDKT